MKVLTLDELRRCAPAAFAETPADHVSDRYSFISTRNIVERMAELEWFPVRAWESRKVRDRLHATHMITFRKTAKRVEVGDTIPELNLFNNHAAMRRATMRAGIYKLACANGLVVSIPGLMDFSLDKIHIDDAAFLFEVAFEGAINQLNKATDQIEQWIKIPLNFVEQNDFAAKAVLLRNHNDPFWSKHFDAHEFLNRRRDADRGNDLWTVFNVVQENIMKGGVQGAVRTTKPITQVAEVQRINEGLWQLATEYGTLHGTN